MTHRTSGSRFRFIVPALLCAFGLGLSAQGGPQLLKPGAQAPELVAEADGGGTLSLSSQRGKVVVLDFWATWCPPCQRSMPHLESVAKAVAGQNVAILGICVWDQRSAYDVWVRQHRASLSFKLGFDPAGHGPANLAAQYNVTGIPTTYVIDPQGRVAETIVGYHDGDTRLEAALRKLGVRIR
ncbi:MAG: TlpA disulfide reductase family protein [Holophaga sp.]|nr:TlpA disulfide reductase family protein [Holophaga sp.]